jgi:hypothetical protein
MAINTPTIPTHPIIILVVVSKLSRNRIFPMISFTRESSGLKFSSIRILLSIKNRV